MARTYEGDSLPELLNATLKLYNPSQYLRIGASPKILDIGCSTAPEVPILKEHLHGAKITGIDTERGPIEIAEKKYPDDLFIEGDALQVLANLPSDFSMLFMLHPYANHEFKEITDKSYNHLVEGGVLFLSYYTASEFKTMKKHVTHSRYNLKVAERNRVQPERGLIVSFQYIIIAQK